MRSLAVAALLVVLAADAVALPADAAAAIDAADRDARIVVLGELHGTREVPALAAALAARRLDEGLPVTLALEINVDEQARIDTYLASAGADADRAALLQGPFWTVPTHRNDGRRSVATLAMLESARQRIAAGADLRVLAFDARHADEGTDERNRRMAAALRDAINDAPERAFVVLIGNYHARRAAPSSVGGLLPGQVPPVPTMAHLADVPMLRINVSARTGEFWACGGDVCGPRPVGARGVWGGDEERAPSYRKTPEDAGRYNAQLVLPHFSVAEPAVRVPPTE